MKLADATVAELLDQIAAGTPSPGGGTAAGLLGAIAAALTEMAASFALTRTAERNESVTSIHVRAGALRSELLALAEADMHAYRPVLDALALARSDERRASALRDARSAAAKVPLEITAASAEVAELAATIMRAPGNRLLLGDAGAALTIAEAAASAAARLVELNLDDSPEDPRLKQATRHALITAELRRHHRTNPPTPYSGGSEPI
jgi:formiminotetrahydrofolate cyclodeaminase